MEEVFGKVEIVNLKKLPGGADTQQGSHEAASNVDVSKLGEIGKNAYLVSQYEKEQNTRGGKK